MADITIHGRSSFTAAITRVLAGEQVDLSGSTVYFEVPSASLRILCTPDGADALALRVNITREQVDQIPNKDALFAVIDETNPTAPLVIADGSILRTGYKGEPQ